MKPITIHIRKDIKMPLGKTIAQASHALGLLFIQRCSVVYESDDSIALSHPSDEIMDYCYAQFIDIKWTTEDKIAQLEGPAIITDSGRTIFKEPTLTAAATTVHPSRPRFAFTKRTEDIEYKQGFFIDRVAVLNSNISNEELIASAAVSSLKCLTQLFDTSGEAILSKNSALYEWLTSLFGKTVVGTKKPTKYDGMVTLIGREHAISAINKGAHNVGFVTEPIKASTLEIHTKSRTFRLLD